MCERGRALFAKVYVPVCVCGCPYLRLPLSPSENLQLKFAYFVKLCYVKAVSVFIIHNKGKEKEE